MILVVFFLKHGFFNILLIRKVSNQLAKETDAASARLGEAEVLPA